MINTNKISAKTIATILAFCGFTPLLMANEVHITQQLLDCAQHIDDSARLNCFDDIATAIQTAHDQKPETQSKEAPPATKQTRSIVDTDAIATEPGKKYLPETAAEKAQPRVFEYTLVAASKDKLGRWEFVLDNGHIWKQVEAKPLPTPRPLPMPVTISRSIVDSYSLRLHDNRRAIKVRRLK